MCVRACKCAYILSLSRSPQHQSLIRVALHIDSLEVDEDSHVSAPN